jgi:hypothetical protein
MIPIMGCTQLLVQCDDGVSRSSQVACWECYCRLMMVRLIYCRPGGRSEPKALRLPRFSRQLAHECVKVSAAYRSLPIGDISGKHRGGVDTSSVVLS